MAAPDVCPVCASAVAPTDHFCEACGHDLAAPAPTGAAVDGPSLDGAVSPGGPASVAGVSVDGAAGTAGVELVGEAGRWITSALEGTECLSCGGKSFGAEGYCDDCGQRRAYGRDRIEFELGNLAAATDKGHRHHRNEDAMALGLVTNRGADLALAIVCDGVSSSDRPDSASHGAVVAAMAAMVAALERDDEPGAAIETAARAAQAAATLAAGPKPGGNPPAATFVCGVVGPDDVTVGWVGDSRAYWVPDAAESGAAAGEPACLTIDDSMAAQAKQRGIALPAGVTEAQSKALVRWLGSDARDTTPHLYRFTPTGPGRVLVCSDGLFRYRPAAVELASSTPADTPLATARALVALALDAGGEDNIAVAILTYPPEQGPAPVPAKSSVPENASVPEKSPVPEKSSVPRSRA